GSPNSRRPARQRAAIRRLPENLLREQRREPAAVLRRLCTSSASSFSLRRRDSKTQSGTNRFPRRSFAPANRLSRQPEPTREQVRAQRKSPYLHCLKGLHSLVFRS